MNRACASGPLACSDGPCAIHSRPPLPRSGFRRDRRLRPGPAHLADFMADCNFARRLKTLGGLTPCEYICKVWTSESEGFLLNPVHQMRGLNTRFLSITPPVLSDGLKGMGRRPGACPPHPGSRTGNGDHPDRNRKPVPKRTLGWPEAGRRP